MKNLTTLIADTKKETNNYKVDFFRLSEVADKKLFDSLLDTPGIMVHDELDSQLTELMKSRNPKTKFTSENKHLLEQLVKDYLKDKDPNEYGVWVYYPWSNKLVHILDENEYIELRTNRNTYKITPEEREKLSKIKVGVIGLSVGQAVSTTMAMERSFGEIRLADFDLLELTNMNRIRTGVHNLGVSKAVSVAREIAEIDPFLKAVCYTEGITEDNMHDFFTKGGNLDILVDECDGLDIKILARYKAKELGIPVIMEASDRGTLDVERYDLEPDRSILHGLIDHLDHKQLKYLKTNEEKIPFILPMLGTHTISKRMKASMVEIEQTITTWPQLSSAVALGGAITADVSRRIILDQYHESGRYFIDLEELVGDKGYEYKSIGDYDQDYSEEVKELTLEEMKLVSKNTNFDYSNTIKLDNTIIEKLITAAGLAPSVGNNQPWKWLHSDGVFFLFHDEKRSVSFADLNHIGSNVALGSTIENLTLKAHELNLNIKVDYTPNKSNRLVAIISFYSSNDIIENIENHSGDDLIDSITIRCTNRNNGVREPVPEPTIKYIKELTETIEGAKLHTITSDKDLSVIENIAAVCDKLRFMHPHGHYDFFKKEIRWNQKEVEETKDGLDIDTLGFSVSEKAGLQIAADPDVIKLLTNWNGGSAFEKMSRKAVQSASAIGLVTIPNPSELDYLIGGRAVQRAWIAANKKGLSFHPLAAAIFLFNKLNNGNNINGIPESMKQEVTGLYQDFLNIFPSVKSQEPLFLFKLGIADKPTVTSLRRPIKDILYFD